MKSIANRDGSEAHADDMPPVVRAIALLLEHAHDRRGAGLALPCPCRECEGHRDEVICSPSEDGRTVVIDRRA